MTIRPFDETKCCDWESNVLMRDKRVYSYWEFRRIALKWKAHIYIGSYDITDLMPLVLYEQYICKKEEVIYYLWFV